MDSIYETVMDPNKSWSEKIGVIAKDPLILFAAGTLFLFGVFWSDSKYTNSFMKRLGWLVWGALFWPALWRKIGVDDALNDLNDFTSSPEFQSGIQSWRQGVQDAIDQAYNGISSIDTTQVGETFDTIWNNIKWVHTQLLERWSGSVSDENLTKFTELTGIEAFLNISKSDLAQINDYNWLLAKIGQENMEKLGFSPEDSDDIKKFIHDYFLPQMGVNDIFVKDLFLSESLKWTVGNMVELTGRSYFPNNATLNEIIKTDISNITLWVNDTLKLAGEKIKTALLTGNFESIQIDNFPSLSENEKSQVKKIIDKINYVLEIEGENGYIHNTQSAITNINLVAETGNSGETKETLNRKLQSLEWIHREYLSRIEAEKTIAKDYDVDSNIFSWSVLESAYMQKKIEILNNAQAKGILTLWGENVATVLQWLETNTKLAEDIEKLNGYIEFLKNTPLPGYEASPKEFLEIYDSLKEIFDDTNTYSNNNDPQIVTLRDAILSFKDTMQDQYESIRQRSDNESNELKEKIAMFSLNNINTFDDFNQLKSDWEDLAQEFESLSESLVPGYTLPDVWTLWERWSAEIPALDSQEDENILNVLDRDFGLWNSQRIQLEDIQRLLDAKKQLILEKRDEVIRIQLEKELQSITLDKINQATIQPAVDFMLKFQENEEVQNTLRTSLNMDANGEIDMSQTNIYDLLAIVDMISQIPINGEDPEDLLQEWKFVRDQVLGLLNGDIIPRLSLWLQELLESTWNGIQNIWNYISYIISN